MKTRMDRIIKAVLLIAIIPLMVVTSCIEKYWPEIKNDQSNLLVVDGRITNESGPYTIILSRSSAIDKKFQSTPVSDAIVMISDNEGNTEILVESEQGVYRTSETGIQGVIGRKYKLTINTAEGKSYNSAFEELKMPTQIEEVKVAEETKKIISSDSVTQDSGFQFYVSTKAAINDTNYYYWELNETYEYHANYEVWFVVNKEDRNSVNGANDLTPVPNKKFLYYCWKTENIDEIFTYSTEYLNEPQIRDLPLHFIPFKYYKLYVKYSLLVKQLTISKNAFIFLNSLKEQRSNQGGLYIKQPFQVRGNVVNIENPDEPVLGFFMAASISTGNRIFVKAPPGYDPIDLCELDIESAIYAQIKRGNIKNWPLYLTAVDMGLVFVPALVSSPECVDCRAKGGKTNKPDYWDSGELFHYN